MLSENTQTLSETTPEFTVTIQGEAKVSPEIYELYKKFGSLMEEAGYKLITGAYGEFVQAVSEAGAEYQPHEMGMPKKILGDVIPENCLDQVKKIDPSYGSSEAWGLRLGLMIDRGGAYASFKGKEGTIAQTVATLAIMSKGFTKKETTRRVALIGWDKEEIEALKTLHLINDDDLDNWVQTFKMDEQGIENSVGYLTTPFTVIDRKIDHVGLPEDSEIETQ